MSNSIEYYSHQLSFLGRRIERLLYVGFILTLISIIALYASQAGLDSVQRDAEILKRVISLIDSEKTELDNLYSLYTLPPKPKTTVKTSTSSLERTRKLLGLGPRTEERIADSQNEKNNTATYHNRLKEIINSQAGARNLVDLDNYNKSPNEIVSELKAKLNSISAKPISAWNIETDQKFRLQYFGSSTTVPITLTATMLCIFLVPITVVWLSSFRITRQRELINIALIDDFKLTFPHFLNVVAVINMPAAREMHQRNLHKAKLFARAWTSVMRFLGIMIITTPLILALSFSCINVIGYYQEIPWYITFFMIVAGIILLLEQLILLFHEFYILRAKDFYEI